MNAAKSMFVYYFLTITALEMIVYSFIHYAYYNMFQPVTASIIR